ncbi:hypothetical protein WJX77_009183 [Trebouxia sp. C0004]
MRGCFILTALVCGACLFVSAELLRDPYKVLGVARGSSESDIRKAYRQLAVRLHPDKNTASGSKAKFLELQEAYELLSNPATRSRYDASGSVSGQPRRQQSQDWRFQHPFYQHHATEQIPTSTMRFTYLNFQQELLQATSPLLVQVYYDYSPVCKAAANEWEQAAKDLSQWARLGRIEWNQQYLLSSLRSFMGLAIRPDDLPLVFGFPTKCHSMACAVRHSGPLKADLLQQFVTDRLLELPPVPAVDPDTIDRFLARVPHHKVAVLAFSTTTKASIPLRHAAEEHKHNVVAGRVQWKAEDLVFWQGKLGVQRAPSVVFLRGPGALPAVYDASNTKRLEIAKLIAENAWQVVQPLRQRSAGPLGCSWGAQAERTPLVSLCVVLIGRQGQHSLRQGRETLAQFSEWMLNRGFLFPRSALPAAKSYSAGQLRLTWLDADTQQAFCKAHLSGVMPKVTASVCGPDWPASLFPWDVVPATAHELPQVQLLAYKPGAGQLPAWWTSPHRFSLYNTTDVTSVRNHSSFTSIASWMSQCLSGKQLQHTIDTPQQLADDESLGWLGFGMSWASKSARWLRQQLLVDMPSLVSWESAQLLLPMLLCGLLAVCVQACSGSTSADATPGARRRHSRPSAAAQQAGDDDDGDDDMQNRFLKTLWQLDTEACLFDPAVHSRLDTGRDSMLTPSSCFVLGLFCLHTQSSLLLEPRISHPPKTTLSADTVCAIGDLHGDLEQGYTALRLAGVVDVQGSWSGGKATLVQTGDLLDRGPNSLDLVELFERLKVEASKAGGNIHTLLGNHEAMNLLGDFRYVSPTELQALGYVQEPHPRTFQGAAEAGLAAWRRRMRKGSIIGITLRRRPAAVILGQGQCKTLFIHAGLPLQLLLNLVKSLDKPEPDAILAKLNEVVSGAVHACSAGHCTKDQMNMLSDASSPLWYRGYVQQYEAEICPEVQQVVQALQVQRIVSGHNIMQNGKIKSLCGGQVNLIDVGMSRAYFGNMAVWRCSNDSAYAVHSDKSHKLPMPSTASSSVSGL